MRTLRAAIFDWAGTAVDFGSMAPVAAFAATFAAAGVAVTDEEIRRPMGLAKRRHLEQMLSDPGIAQRWRALRGTQPRADDIDALYRAFDGHLLATVAQFAQPVPGLIESVAALRAKGVRIGSNTGYARHVMDVLAPAAKALGFDPDCIVTASDVAASRPAPDMSWKCLDTLGLARDCDAVKIDDTVAGIEEGRNAGLWTVAVAISGNEAGLSHERWSELSSQERQVLRTRAYDRLGTSGADYVIDSVAELGETIDAIETRIGSGERAALR